MSDKKSFLKSGELVIRKEDFVAEIPAGLENRQDLFKALQGQLKFPDYFGHNWDALDECLHDLCWIEQRRVVIIHHDVPMLPSKDTEIYIDVLKSCLRYWADKAEHEVLVVMP